MSGSESSGSLAIIICVCFIFLTSKVLGEKRGVKSTTTRNVTKFFQNVLLTPVGPSGVLICDAKMI